MKLRYTRAILSSLLISLAVAGSSCGHPEQNEISEVVRRRAAELIQTNAGAIHLSRPLVKQGADELDVVELIMAMEEEFRIEIPDHSLGTNAEDVSNSLTVDKLARIIKEQRALRESQPSNNPQP